MYKINNIINPLRPFVCVGYIYIKKLRTVATGAMYMEFAFKIGSPRVHFGYEDTSTGQHITYTSRK